MKAIGLLSFGLFFSLSACGGAINTTGATDSGADTGSTSRDTGTAIADSSVHDGSTLDTSVPDTSAVDTGSADTGVADSGGNDAAIDANFGSVPPRAPAHRRRRRARRTSPSTPSSSAIRTGPATPA